jgi:DNA-binding transcriptional LysR family regulator
MHHIRQLQCADALEATGHFGRAADRLGVTQSALTQSIQKLEEFYGVSLFVRDRRQITPTPFGEIIVDRAREALQSIATADREIQLMRNLETGHLIVGADPLLTGSLLAPALNTMLAAHPQLRFSVRTGDWTTFKTQLLERKIDLYLGFSQFNLDDQRVDQKSFSMPPPILVCGPSHPIAGIKSVSLETLLQHPLVSPSPPDWFLDWATQEGTGRSVEEFQAHYVLTAEDLHLVKEIVKRGSALTAALPDDLKDEIERGHLVPVHVTNWPTETPISIATLSRRALPPAAVLLTNEISSLAAALVPRARQ